MGSYAKSRTARAQGNASYAKYGGLLHPLAARDFPWEVINVDLIMGLPRRREDFDAIVTFLCQVVKTAHFVPACQTTTAEELGNELVRSHEVPSAVIGDRDSRFTSNV